MGIVLLTAVVLHYRGVIGRRSILSLMFLLLLVTGLPIAFSMAVPYLNCVLLRDHSIVEQPYKSENMTQRMVHEAVDFIDFIAVREAFLIYLDLKTLLLQCFIVIVCFCRTSNRPFLLLFSFLQVHTAIFASAAFRGTSRHGIYGDAVQEVDWSVGRSFCLFKGKAAFLCLSVLSNPVKKAQKLPTSPLCPVQSNDTKNERAFRNNR